MGATAAEIIREFGRNPRGFQGTVAKYRRPATLRRFPWRPAAALCSVESFVFPPLPQLGVGSGVLGARNTIALGGKLGKYGGLYGGVSKFRRPPRSVAFPGAPWRSTALCLFGIFVFPHLPPVGRWERWRRVPEILENLGEIRKIWRIPGRDSQI